MYGRENAPPLLRLFKEGNRNLKAIHHSSVPETLASLISEQNVDTLSLDTIISVIEAITAVTLYKPVAQRVSELGVGKDLVRIIQHTKDFRSYVVSQTIEALWNLIEVVGQDAVRELARHPQVVPSLKQIFQVILEKGYKLDDKCLRNEVCVVLNYVVQQGDSHPFFLQTDSQSGEDETILAQLINYAVFDEVNGGESLQRKPLFSTADQDLELKRMLWSQVFHVSRDPFNIEAH